MTCFRVDFGQLQRLASDPLTVRVAQDFSQLNGLLTDVVNNVCPPDAPVIQQTGGYFYIFTVVCFCK